MTKPIQPPPWFTFPRIPLFEAAEAPTWRTEATSRDRAISAAATHDAGVMALRNLSVADGGGLTGVVKGVLKMNKDMDWITEGGQRGYSSCSMRCSLRGARLQAVLRWRAASAHG